MNTPEAQLRAFVFLERLWLTSTILGIALTIFFLIIKDNDSTLFFFGFFILSGLLYILRKRQRVRYEKKLKS